MLFPRGGGSWSLNESLLDNVLFVENMNNFIKSQYDELKDENIYDDCMIWDLLKVGIRDNCVSFSRQLNVEEFTNQRIK